VKPVGSTCNLDCTYCYYLSKEQLFDVPAATRMDDDTLERVVQQYIEGVTAEDVVFTWQGGEPTLLGLEFFQRAVALQRKYKKPNQRIENDLQTNGTLLNEEWCEFLRDNKFLVGLSIDGPRDLHDHYRVTKGNRPTFDRVFNASKMLRRYGIPFNTLTCVHRYNARKPLEVYRFLRVLSGAGLPQGHITTLLLFFRIGVVSGHFLLIGAVLSLIGFVRCVHISFPF
jgi:uncharacterized protein